MWSCQIKPGSVFPNKKNPGTCFSSELWQRQMSPPSAYFSFARVTPEHASHMTCCEIIVTFTCKTQQSKPTYLGESSFLCLFQTHPSTAVLSGANQWKCGLGSSEDLFYYCLMCSPGCNEVNTEAKGCVDLVVVVSNSFQFWGFLPPCLGESRTVCAFSWKIIAFILRWSSVGCVESRDAPLPRKPKTATR